MYLTITDYLKRMLVAVFPPKIQQTFKDTNFFYYRAKQSAKQLIIRNFLSTPVVNSKSTLHIRTCNNQQEQLQALEQWAIADYSHHHFLLLYDKASGQWHFRGKNVFGEVLSKLPLQLQQFLLTLNGESDANANKAYLIKKIERHLALKSGFVTDDILLRKELERRIECYNGFDDKVDTDKKLKDIKIQFVDDKAMCDDAFADHKEANDVAVAIYNTQTSQWYFKGLGADGKRHNTVPEALQPALNALMPACHLQIRSDAKTAMVHSQIETWQRQSLSQHGHRVLILFNQQTNQWVYRARSSQGKLITQLPDYLANFVDDLDVNALDEATHLACIKLIRANEKALQKPLAVSKQGHAQLLRLTGKVLGYGIDTQSFSANFTSDLFLTSNIFVYIAFIADFISTYLFGVFIRQFFTEALNLCIGTITSLFKTLTNETRLSNDGNNLVKPTTAERLIAGVLLAVLIIPLAIFSMVSAVGWLANKIVEVVSGAVAVFAYSIAQAFSFIGRSISASFTSNNQKLDIAQSVINNAKPTSKQVLTVLAPHNEDDLKAGTALRSKQNQEKTLLNLAEKLCAEYATLSQQPDLLRDNDDYRLAVVTLIKTMENTTFTRDRDVNNTVKAKRYIAKLKTIAKTQTLTEVDNLEMKKYQQESNAQLYDAASDEKRNTKAPTLGRNNSAS